MLTLLQISTAEAVLSASLARACRISMAFQASKSSFVSNDLLRQLCLSSCDTKWRPRFAAFTLASDSATDQIYQAQSPKSSSEESSESEPHLLSGVKGL